MSDRLLGAVCLLLGAAFVWGATRIETGFIVDPLGPRAFPVIIGLMMMAGALYPLLRPDPEPGWPGARAWLEIVLVLAAFLAYALLLTTLGFVPATALAAGFVSWRLGSRPLGAVLCGVGVAVGIYVAFHLVLGLSLARGPLGV